MIHVGDPIRPADDLALQRIGEPRPGVAENAHANLVGQVQPLAVLFQAVHHPQTLLVVPEGLPQAGRQSSLPGVAEGGVAQVVAHGNGLRQVLVQAQCPGDGFGDPSNLQGVGHPGPVVIPFRPQKYLGLVHQPPEGLAVHHPVCVPLEAGPHIFHPLRLLTRPAGGAVGEGRQWVQASVLQTLQFFPYGHG